MKRIAIVGAKRSPIGSLGGALSTFSPAQLGAQVARATIAGHMPTAVIMGNVISAGLGQNIARQVAIHADLPVTTEAYTVGKVCGSGIKAIEMAMMEIQAGNHDVVLAGGIEILSQAPFYSPANTRFGGAKFGDITLKDAILRDGLEDAFEPILMGDTAEELAEIYKISREEQDEFALLSQNRAEEAIEKGLFSGEIVGIDIKKGKTSFHFAQDEYPRPSTSLESLGKLKPAFKKDGTVTAGNSSGLNDGVAFVLLASEEKVKELGLEPLAWVDGASSVGLSPRRMGLGPVEATYKLLNKIDWQFSDLEHIELNEAFSAQGLAVLKEWESHFGSIDMTRINPQGGAIALGHPLGATGARLVVTLVNAMKRGDLKKGMATLCIGGGQGMSIGLSRD